MGKIIKNPRRIYTHAVHARVYILMEFPPGGRESKHINV